MTRLVLFAHYDQHNRIRPYILHYLKHLREVCDEIFFISTSALPTNELNLVRPFCQKILLQGNKGLDFFMWKSALAQTDMKAWHELVLTNSSVFGPLCPLGPIFKKMNSASNIDFWGMTESFEIAWHLQSYFLVLKTNVLRSRAFTDFWLGVIPYQSRDQVIRSYEIGLSTWLQEHEFHGQALVPWSTLPKRSRQRPNPLLSHTLPLLQRGFPFVKVALLRDNPNRVALQPIYQAMDHAGYPRRLIEFDRDSE